MEFRSFGRVLATSSPTVATAPAPHGGRAPPASPAQAADNIVRDAAAIATRHGHRLFDAKPCLKSPHELRPERSTGNSTRRDVRNRVRLQKEILHSVKLHTRPSDASVEWEPGLDTRN
jgi:hypothetical protein